jgi:hypothetical protein
MVAISATLVKDASSRKYASPELFAKGSAVEIRDRYLAEIRRRGYDVSVKKGSNISGVRGWANDRLFLAGDWNQTPPMYQARTLVHEFVHIEQRKRLGRAKFQLAYARPGNAWAFECQAYREGIDFMRAHPEMFSAQQVDAEIARIPETLWDVYLTLRVFTRSDLRAKTIAAMA